MNGFRTTRSSLPRPSRSFPRSSLRSLPQPSLRFLPPPRLLPSGLSPLELVRRHHPLFRQLALVLPAETETTNKHPIWSDGSYYLDFLNTGFRGRRWRARPLDGGQDAVGVSLAVGQCRFQRNVRIQGRLEAHCFRHVQHPTKYEKTYLERAVALIQTFLMLLKILLDIFHPLLEVMLDTAKLVLNWTGMNKMRDTVAKFKARTNECRVLRHRGLCLVTFHFTSPQQRQLLWDVHDVSIYYDSSIRIRHLKLLYCVSLQHVAV